MTKEEIIKLCEEVIDKESDHHTVFNPLLEQLSAAIAEYLHPADIGISVKENVSVKDKFGK